MADRRARRPIGGLIRRAMMRKGIKQGQLADAIGASRSAVNSWINDRACPQDWMVGPLEDYLGIRLDNEDEDPVVAYVQSIPDDDVPPEVRAGIIQIYLDHRDRGAGSVLAAPYG